jgi:hypothetical protein
MTKNWFFRVILIGSISIWSTTTLISYGGQSAVTFMVSAKIENGVPKGQILKSKEPYSAVPHMKALDECCPDQLKCWCYGFISWRWRKIIFQKECQMHLFTPESMHTRVGGDLNQCMSESGEDFWKILFALWATWFIVEYDGAGRQFAHYLFIFLYMYILLSRFLKKKIIYFLIF